jgi:uncharacterized protein (DUF2147 family)
MKKTLVAPALLASLLGLMVPVASEPARASDTVAVDGKMPPEAILGEWLTEGKDGRIRFTKSADGTYTGVLTWSAKPAKDSKNPDPKLRGRSIVGIVLMWHLSYKDGEYEDGYCYNPQDGNTYRMSAHVQSATNMSIHGYLAIPLFGQTQRWTRYR